MKTGRWHKLIICVLMLLGAMLALAGCTTFDSFRYTFLEKADDTGDDHTIYIGVFEAQSGKYAGPGLAEIKGIELANSIYNSVNGYHVELIKVDTQSSTTVAETAIQGLIEMKPVAIIGSEGEATSLVASKYIRKAGIPMITPSATNPLITQGNIFYFRACITESQMGAAIAEYAYDELKSRKIGIALGSNDTAATALMDGFNDKIREYVSKRSKAVAVEESLSFSEKEMKKLIKKLKKKNVDVLFIPQGTETMDQFFTFIEENDLTNITFIGSRSWAGNDFIEMMKKHPDIKIAFPSDTVLDENNDEVTEEAERFTILYHNKYGDDETPNHYAALGYDSYLLLINAIYNSKELDGYSVRNALADLKGIKGATGTYSFDVNGNTLRSVTISTISNRKIKSVYVSSEKTETKQISSAVSDNKSETSKKETKKSKAAKKTEDKQESDE